ncbi:uncharacterized protein LOC113799424 [Dermatophagoides pteronyssinus]|uniref:uncharacterized protein LOC113799424 n=1 Tax=Dermatophagoides pteronyssinus TaxID=6956 RepID=UPI003F66DA7C
MKPKNLKPRHQQQQQQHQNPMKKLKNKFDDKKATRAKKEFKNVKKAESGDEEIFYEICPDTNYSKLFNNFQEFLIKQINDSFGIKINNTGLNFENFIQLLNRWDGNLEDMMQNLRLEFKPQVLVVKTHSVSTMIEQNHPSTDTESDQGEKTLHFGDLDNDVDMKKIDSSNDGSFIQPAYVTNEETYIYPNELIFK